MASIPMFEEMIVTGGWWDYVDAIATHQLRDVLQADPGRMSALMRRWARDANMWKRRASILCQIGCKRQTDLALLYDCIEPSIGDLRARRKAKGQSRNAGDPEPKAQSRKPGGHKPGAAPDEGPRMEDQFFIRKALGWALRQYARVDPKEVERYVKANRARLSGLSIREALKNL
jgi:3-methyladenine DNA glycosylase AlkD